MNRQIKPTLSYMIEDIKEALIKSFDKHSTTGKQSILFVVSLSNALLSEVEEHEETNLFSVSLNKAFPE